MLSKAFNLSRYNIMDKALIPFLQLADLSATVSFYLEFIKPVMAGMSVVVYGTSQEQLGLLVTKTGNFKILQVCVLCHCVCHVQAI